MLQVFIEAEDHEDLVRQIKGLAALFDGGSDSESKVTKVPETVVRSVPDAGPPPHDPGDDETQGGAPAAAPVDPPAPTKKTADLAEQLGVDLAGVEGTGKNGRVTQADVKLAAKSTPATETSEGPSTEPEAPDTPATVPPNDPFGEEGGEETNIEPTKENATAALRVVHGTNGMDGCMAILKQFEARKMGEVAESQYGAFIDACANAVNLDRAQMSGRLAG